MKKTELTRKIRNIFSITIQDVLIWKQIEGREKENILEAGIKGLHKNTILDSNHSLTFLREIGNNEICDDVRESVRKGLVHQKRGAIAIFASVDGVIVGVYCICTMPEYTPYDFMNEIAIEGKTEMIFQCMTSNKYRNMGIYKRALRLLCELSIERSNRVIITTSPFNKKSTRAIIDSGFKRKGRLLHVRIMGKDHSMTVKS